jgi:hypothetical protein
MTANQWWDIIINGIGLLSIACLSVPALHANKYGKLIYRLSTIKGRFADPNINQVRHELLQNLRELQSQWTAWKGRLLIGGTILAGVSYVLALMKVYYV